jgi:hypothetical protein
MAKSGKKLSTPARKSGKKSNAAIRSESPGPKASTSKSEPKRLAPTKAQAGVTRTTAGSGDGAAKKKSPVARAASRVGKAIRSVTAKLRPGAAKAKQAKQNEESAAAAQTPRAVKKVGSQKAARVARRESDVPMDRLAETYTPSQTSLKSGMRGNGTGRDQELGGGVADDRWNDEDVITNKSGDPRIGTHGRTYEPGEARAATSGDTK